MYWCMSDCQQSRGKVSDDVALNRCIHLRMDSQGKQQTCSNKETVAHTNAGYVPIYIKTV